MKGKKPKQRKKTSKPSLDLIEKRTATGKIVTFPGVQGRTVERVRLFTSTDDHTVSIDFEDQTLLSIRFEPGFFVRASLANIKTGNFRAIREWPRIVSAPRNPG
jgi:hypothetical protein